MLKAVVEILPIKPCETNVIIVPLFEQLIDVPADSAAKPPTLALALYLYAAGEAGPLLSVLEGDEHACDFVFTQFEETWFVRTEPTSGFGGSNIRDLVQAVQLAHVYRGRHMACRAMNECGVALVRP